MKTKEVLFVWNKLKLEISEGAKHTKALLRHNDVVVVRTYMSRGAGKLDGDVPHMIRQQMKLNAEQFRLIHDCTYWRSDYLRILTDRGMISGAPESP